MEAKQKKKVGIIKLLLIFFKMGAVTFGGGYAMLPIIENDVVKKHGLITKEEYIDFVSVAQSFPGPVAVNMALLIGKHLRGFAGGVFALIGVTLPSFISIIAVAVFYIGFRNSKIVSGFFKGINPVIPALLLYSAVSIFGNVKKNTVTMILAGVTVIGVFFFNLSPLWLILLGVITGICMHYFKAS